VAAASIIAIAVFAVFIVCMRKHKKSNVNVESCNLELRETEGFLIITT